jgi:chromosome segregation ATPase
MNIGLEQMEKDIQEIKVQVELIKKDIHQFEKLVDKLDTTNDKIQELINNITLITSQHQQKITDSETNFKYVWEEIGDMKIKIESEKITIDTRITELEKSKWMIIGGLSFLTLILNLFSTFMKS